MFVHVRGVCVISAQIGWEKWVNSPRMKTVLASQQPKAGSKAKKTKNKTKQRLHATQKEAHTHHTHRKQQERKRTQAMSTRTPSPPPFHTSGTPAAPPTPPGRRGRDAATGAGAAAVGVESNSSKLIAVIADQDSVTGLLLAGIGE